jgi:hypothetical protein
MRFIIAMLIALFCQLGCHRHIAVFITFIQSYATALLRILSSSAAACKQKSVLLARGAVQCVFTSFYMDEWDEVDGLDWIDG